MRQNKRFMSMEMSWKARVRHGQVGIMVNPNNKEDLI